ncbi:hypothetical protein [Breznakiella homolactica]|uniref:Outer membrane protein beta-barrel domain-containing protein n=1 Tax=Breznakiella homolactica TaxID=2798577 RepID=A0A7T8BB16_9SPIR|nr:hypothetical protein [Breznakiella homolactica]QQO09936.1 hypothetical protein JFL75_03215 [Breznakiella homolactica]
MKKIIMVFLIMCAFGSCLFANSSRMISFGAGFGMVWENLDNKDLYYNKDVYYNKIDFNFNYFQFFGNGRFGFFVNAGVGYPFNYQIDGTHKDTDYGVDVEVTIGPSCRFMLTDRLDILTGIGFHIPFMRNRGELPPYGPPSFARSCLSLGVGGILALKVNLGKSLYLDAGTTLAMDFATYEFEYDKWIDSYSGFIIRPFVGVGFSV